MYNTKIFMYLLTILKWTVFVSLGSVMVRTDDVFHLYPQVGLSGGLSEEQTSPLPLHPQDEILTRQVENF